MVFLQVGHLYAVLFPLLPRQQHAPLLRWGDVIEVAGLPVPAGHLRHGGQDVEVAVPRRVGVWEAVHPQPQQQVLLLLVQADAAAAAPLAADGEARRSEDDSAGPAPRPEGDHGWLGRLRGCRVLR